MPLILAIEPDRRQGARIASLARERLHVELLVVDSVAPALKALDERTPDLILTPLMLSGKDEAALDDRLRQLDAGGAHVQTLVIPVLASSGRRAAKGSGLLNRLRRSKTEQATEANGCDPAVFAAQIAEYLERAAEERATALARAEDERHRQARELERAPKPAASADSAPVAPAIAAEETVDSGRAFAQSHSSGIPALTDLVDDQDLVVPNRIETAPIEAAQPVAEAPYEAPAPEPVLADAVDRPTELTLVTADHNDPTDGPDSLEIVDVPVMMFDTASDEALAGAEALSVAELPQSQDEVPYEAPTPDDAESADEVREAFEEFIEFDDLSIVEVPTVTFGELAGVMDMPAGASSRSQRMDGLDVGDPWEALERPQGRSLDQSAADDLDLSVFAQDVRKTDAAARPEPITDLDALELLEDPELPAAIQLEPEPRVESLEEEPDSTTALDFDNDLWMPLPVAAERRWPRLEGPAVRATLTPSFDAPPDSTVQFAIAPPAERATGKKAAKSSNKPFQDEWGFFDPVQCGFAALLAKLDEVTDKEDSSAGTKAS